MLTSVIKFTFVLSSSEVKTRVCSPVHGSADIYTNKDIKYLFTITILTVCNKDEYCMLQRYFMKTKQKNFTTTKFHYYGNKIGFIMKVWRISRHCIMNVFYYLSAISSVFHLWYAIIMCFLFVLFSVVKPYNYQIVSHTSNMTETLQEEKQTKNNLIKNAAFFK